MICMYSRIYTRIRNNILNRSMNMLTRNNYYNVIKVYYNILEYCMYLYNLKQVFFKGY